MAFTRTALACAAVAAALTIAPPMARSLTDRFTDWSEPVNLGPAVNSEFEDFGAAISRDGLSLYFHSGRPGGFGGTDIWVSRRTSETESWGSAENLGPDVNTPFSETTPRVSLDGHRLYFASTRPGGLGGSDLYVARRRNARDDLAWQPAENLGEPVNSPANEGGPSLLEDDLTGTLTLYFGSNRPGGPGGADIYASTLQPDETFGLPALVAELNSSSADQVPTIRRDGLEMLFQSNRPGSIPFPSPFTGRSLDLWVSTRSSTSDSWSQPATLGPVVNTVFNDGWAALSFDGTILYFARCGDPCQALDLYTSTRRRLRAARHVEGRPSHPLLRR